MKKFTLKQGLEVAKKDYFGGVSLAIELLEDMGFDCSYYWQTMAKVDEEDADEMNLKTRDALYKRLGIMETMEKAYNKVWR